MTEVKITIVTEDGEQEAEQRIRNALRSAAYDISEITTKDISEPGEIWDKIKKKSMDSLT